MIESVLIHKKSLSQECNDMRNTFYSRQFSFHLYKYHTLYRKTLTKQKKKIYIKSLKFVSFTDTEV